MLKQKAMFSLFPKKVMKVTHDDQATGSGLTSQFSRLHNRTNKGHWYHPVSKSVSKGVLFIRIFSDCEIFGQFSKVVQQGSAMQ